MDGTLIESGPGIVFAIREMMKDLGLPDMQENELSKFVGPPLMTGFSELLGLSGSALNEAIALYRKKYDELGLNVTSAYKGIPELLCELKSRGKKLGVVTSKIQPTAEAHLKRFGLWQYIDYLRGGDPQGIGEKEYLLKLAVSDMLSKDREPAVMVGDRLFDLNAAHVAGMDCIGVLYGYGTSEEIEACKPTYVARSVEELAKLLLT